MMRRGRILAFFAGLACLAQAEPSFAQEPQPQVHQPFWQQRLSGWLPVRDGTELRFSVLLPQGEGPFPVIINYSGYDPGAIGGPAYLADDTAMSVNLDRTLVQAGYAVVGINARGTGCSTGTFDFLGPAYGIDGYDAVEWVAAQPWSSGAVGMANWSWAGMSQLATAIEQPPHLRAIAPGMVLADARLDSWAPGGVPAPAFVAGWWDYLQSRWATVEASARAEGDAMCLDRLARNKVTAEPNRLSNVVIRHPLRDAFIEQRNLAARTHRITVPVLSMTAFQDEAVTSRDGHYQETLTPGLLWQVQTNGGHDLYESVRFRETLVAFFDRFVKGVDNGFDAKARLELWLESTSTGEGHAFQEAVQPRSVVTSADPVPPLGPLELHLQAGGGMTGTLPSASMPASYAYPVGGPLVNVDADAWGPMPATWREGSLAFTSPPLDAGLLAYGPASADLWLSSTATDADVQVTLTELRRDGQEMFVQRGWLRLSNRAQDPARATVLRPFPLDRPETMEALRPAEPVLARVELPKFAHPFRTGSRIRIWIDTPSAWGGYGFSPASLPATNFLWHDPEHSSRLVLGVWRDVAVVGELSRCGEVLRQPCRPDPISDNHGALR